MSFAQLAPGTVFAGRYVVERPLGGGGMGSVFVAQHAATHRRVALKLMHGELVAEPGLRDRFAQEAQVSSLIRSKNVVEVLDAGVDVSTGTPFLAMELLEGRDLGEVVRTRGALPPDEALRLLAQVARGLDRAHAAGVVHRDLKPENLFLCADDDGSPLVKILDFGLAKLLAGSSGATTLAAGTPTYMAPEQLGKAPITRAADVWAFGLIAFTLLTGHTYWNVGSIGELYGALFAPAYPSALARAQSLGVALPPAFEAWFQRCAAREPAQRFATAGEACEQLRVALGVGASMAGTLVATPGATSVPPPPPPPMATPAGTHGYAIPPTHLGATPAPWPAPPGYVTPQPGAPRATAPNTGGSGLVVAIVAIALGVFALGGVVTYVAMRHSTSAHESSTASKDDDDDDRRPKRASRAAAKRDDDDEATKPSKPKGELLDGTAEHLQARFPEGFPTATRSKQPLPGVPGVDLVMYTAENLRGACLVGYIDYKTKAVFAGRTTKMAFDGARDGALANMGATLEDEKDFEYQGYPARVFTFKGFSMGRQIYGRQLLILEDVHLYQLMFIGYTKGERDEADIEAFFDSLVISP